MSVFQMTFPAGTLKTRANVVAVLPDHIREERRLEELPVVYLLHGLGGSREDWLHGTPLARLADEYQLVVILPEGGRSFYADLPNGPLYQRYLSEELPERIGSWMKIGRQRDQTYIGGCSMGGYGALRTAVLHPEQYRGAASFSGVLGLQPLAMIQDEEPALFLELQHMMLREPESLHGSDMDPAEWIGRLQRSAAEYADRPLQLSLCCGTEDPFLMLNRLFARQCREAGIGYTYREDSGAHDYRFWERMLPLWFREIRTAAKPGGRSGR